MEICINGISVKTIIGCYSHERERSQELILNVTLELDNMEILTTDDNLSSTIDYDEIINFIKDDIQKTNYQLLEKLALHINNSILTQYEMVKSITVEIIKPAICGVLAREIKVRHKTLRKYKVALSLGTNTENMPKQQIINAIEIISQYFTNMKISKLYKTKPYGFLAQNNFYNAAITGYTSLKPEILLAKIKKIEKMLGKSEVCLNGPRQIDIDIIFFEGWIYQEKFLTIPHEGMHLRDFVLKPLLDIDSSWIHPIFNKDVNELYNNLNKDEATILQIEDYE